MKKALWWQKTETGNIECLLCPRSCVISEDKSGFCSVRKNISGELIALSYGYPVALQVDPIEKKPLYEYLPRTRTFSLGTYGCNLDCVFCQNYHLSRGTYHNNLDYYSPEIIVQMAIQQKCDSVAFTYNEPTVFAEYAIDIAKEAHKKGLGTVLVSNGYISLKAAEDLYPHIDAANIDIKGFSEEFYSSMTKSQLQPVLDAIKYYHSLPDTHLELTNLIIPGKNDSEDMINAYLDWIEKDLDKEIPLHFSAYHPDYRYSGSPATPPETLHSIKTLANSRGFEHIYLGNIW